MKFGEFLESCKVGSLADGYLHYEELARKAEVVQATEVDEDGSHAGSHAEFCDALVEELARVSDFAAGQLERLRADVEGTDTLLQLCDRLEAVHCLCGHVLPAHVEFCPSCNRSCRCVCGNIYGDAARFCRKCGSPRPDGPPAVQRSQSLLRWNSKEQEVQRGKSADGRLGESEGHATLARESKMQMLSVYKQQLHNVYQRVFEFKQMCELNLQGFQKLIKKRNKALKRDRKMTALTISSAPASRKESLAEPLLHATRESLQLVEEGAARARAMSKEKCHASGAPVQICTSDDEAVQLPCNQSVDIKYVRQQPFWAVHFEGAQDLAREIEQAFAKNVTGGQVGRAQMRLRVFQREALSQMALLEVGVCVGMSITLAFSCGVLLGYPSDQECPACTVVLYGMVPVYRLTFVPILWIICWSGLCYVWRAKDINYPYILEIDPHTELGVWRALKLGTKLLAVWLLFLFLFLFGTQTGALPLWGIDSRYYPLAFTMLCVVMIMSPRGMCYFKTRKWLAVSLLRVIQAPTREVKLRENLVADVLTSMVKEIVDLYYTWKLFATGDFQHKKLHHFPDQFSRIGPMLIIIAPYWCRLFQCLRRYWDSCVASRVRGSRDGCCPSVGLLGLGDGLHLINAGKYFSSICAISLSALGGFRHIVGPYVIWSPFRKIWLALLVISALYAYVWDIIQDMGLVKLRRSEETGRLELYLRTHGSFSDRGLVVWLALSNFVGRMAWAVTIVPRGRFSVEAAGIPAVHMDSFITVAEVLRRAQWTLLRVEHEHAENPNNYRSIVEVPSATLHREDGEEEIHTSGEASAAISVVVVLAMFLVLSAMMYYTGVRVPGHGLTVRHNATE